MPKWTIFLKSSKVSNSQSKEFVLITEILWRIFWHNNWRSLIGVLENFTIEYRPKRGSLIENLTLDKWKTTKFSNAHCKYIQWNYSGNWTQFKSINFTIICHIHTVRFFIKFVSWVVSPNIYRPTKWPRKQKIKPLKSFWNKPPSNP